MKHARTAILYILFLSAAGSLSAQVMFRTLGLDAAPTGLNYEQEHQDVPVTIQQDLRSLPYTYSGASPLVLYKISTGPDGKAVRNPEATIDLVSGGTYPLLLFINDSASPSKFRVLTLKEDPASFPGGACRFMNFSKLPVQVSLQKENFYLPPGATVDKRPAGATAMLSVSALPKGSSPVPILTYNMLCEPSGRQLILIVPAAGTPDSVTVKRLSDNVPIH